MLNKLLAAAVVLMFLIIATACGGAYDTPEFAQTSAPGDLSTPSSAGAPATGRVVLATPTPLPPPPTPTPRPPAPTPKPAATSEQAAPAEQTEPVQSAPAVTDIMIEIPAGPFTMGSDDGDPEDAPAHEVDLPAFEIDKFEVTNADFDAFTKQTDYETYAEKQGNRGWRSEFNAGTANHPVVNVTWDDAQAYCEWLGKRLPSEAEWEKAARGTDGLIFPWGNDWDPNKANVKERGLRGTAAVGSFGEGASPYGVEDMVGNVWEWTADWYQPYPGNSAQDPYYGEKYRVNRGGGWFEEEAQSTTFSRNAADPIKTYSDDLGFRCAR
jgi:formylglycine-generating enzyme required for sulfatase activity